MTTLIDAFHNFTNAPKKDPTKWYKHSWTEINWVREAEVNLTLRLVFQSIFVQSFKYSGRRTMTIKRNELQYGRGKLFYFFMWTCLVLAVLSICLVIAIILLRSHFTACGAAEGMVSHGVRMTSHSGIDMEEGSTPRSLPWELDYRLPSDTDPIHYDIFLHPDLSNNTFSGKVVIQIHVKKPRHFLLVNTKHLDIYDTRLTEVVAVGNEETDNFKKKRVGEEREIKIEDAFEYKPNEFWVTVIKNNKELQPGIYNLHLQFRGSLSGKIVGFYSSTYTDSKTQEKRFV
jgi:hypothetical protein